MCFDCGTDTDCSPGVCAFLKVVKRGLSGLLINRELHVPDKVARNASNGADPIWKGKIEWLDVAGDWLHHVTCLADQAAIALVF